MRVVDFDRQLQDAIATVVFRLDDLSRDRWEPTDRTRFYLHFLALAVRDDLPLIGVPSAVPPDIEDEFLHRLADDDDFEDEHRRLLDDETEV